MYKTPNIILTASSQPKQPVKMPFKQAGRLFAQYFHYCKKGHDNP